MNPFEDKINEDIINDFFIEIWLESTGRKKNTFISGWNIQEKELKEHIKFIKKKNGCNGTIKDKMKENSQTIIQLQGNHIEYMKKYLIDIGIANIRVKG
jgi:translation initiation factor 1 (eIF-1/SUI1)